MASIGMLRAQDENEREPILTSPGAKMTRKRKMEERDENSQGEQQTFEWENSKENVMPLKRGRNVDDLNRALRAQESFEGKNKLEQEAKEMEESVYAYKGSDPLSAWAAYVKWIETNMPEDTRKKFTALEKCTRELKDHAQYKNDIRYIRLWIQYADLVSNPKDIFKYLYQNKIGEHVSLFYVGWAWVLESMANYAQAHKVYLKATQKKALPEDLLDRKYKEFQRRMSRHWLKVSSSEGGDSATGNQRFALEDISTDGADIQRFGNSENFRRYAQAQAEKMQRANAHKPVFTVYEDTDGAEVDSFPSGADWKKLDTALNQNKENDIAPTRWNEAPLQVVEDMTAARSAAPSSRPAETLQVFVDDEFSSSEPQIPHSHSRESSLTLRQRLEGTATEEEQLAQQPLKNFKESTKKPEHKPPRVHESVKPKGEKFAYSVALLKSESGSEMCFEEVRARKFATKRTASFPRPSRPSVNSFLAEEPAEQRTNVFLQNDLNALPSSIKAKSPKLPIGRHEDKLAPSTDIGVLNAAAQEDMTINTRLAMEDVNSMFCSPTRDEKQPVVKATVWEVPEPVERKLHFSIFEDSVDSIALNPNELSLRNDAVEQAPSTSFHVFADEVPQPTAPRTASKMSARKPLSSRDDLARRSRLTNKDMIMKIETEEKDGDEDTSAKTHPSAAKRIECVIPPCRSMTSTHDVANSSGRTRQPSIICPRVRAAETVTRDRSPLSLDPYDPEIRKQMLESEKVQLFAASNPDLVCLQMSKTPSLWCSNHQRRRLKRSVFFHLDEKVSVEAVGFLGSGAFAQVFSVKVEGLDPAPKSMAMKLEKTKNNLLWELYVMQEIRKRVKVDGSQTHIPLPRFSRLDIFKNGATLLMDKASAGTLHDLLNLYRKAGKAFPETLAVHYAIKMLYAIEILHQAGILHGDIKPDNWLVVPSSPKEQCSKNVWQISSSTSDLCLIDFGRSIDLTHYQKGVTFHGDCHVKGFQTIEMIMKRPWTTQIDTFGICATIYCMLFGDYMEVTKKVKTDGSVCWMPAKKFKRYWQVDLWRSFFHVFLNVESCDNQPSIASHRRHFERFFEESTYRQQELRELLTAQDRLLSKPRL